MIPNEVEVVQATPQRLGPVGVVVRAVTGIDRSGAAGCPRIEEMGYGSIWTGEGAAGGRGTRPLVGIHLGLQRPPPQRLRSHHRPSGRSPGRRRTPTDTHQGDRAPSSPHAHAAY
jgi:hypothetical protein